MTVFNFFKKSVSVLCQTPAIVFSDERFIYFSFPHLIDLASPLNILVQLLSLKEEMSQTPGAVVKCVEHEQCLVNSIPDKNTNFFISF